MLHSTYEGTVKGESVVGAWWPVGEKGKTGLQVVFTTPLGTAHAGWLRKTWRVPDHVIRDINLKEKVNAIDFGPAKLLHEKAPYPRVHPILTADDKEIADAFGALIKEPSFSKLPLTDWEFKLACDAPIVFLQYGGFTWKQRKYLRQIAKKVLEISER
jgi:hypothetical protein